MTATEQVGEALAGIPEVIGCAVLRPDRKPEPGWLVFTLADGQRARVDFAGSPTARVLAQVQAILSAFAPQQMTPVQAARARAKRLARAIDPQVVLLRASLRVVFAVVKECREQLGLPSRTWEQLLTAVQQQIDAGGGDPSAN